MIFRSSNFKDFLLLYIYRKRRQSKREKRKVRKKKDRKTERKVERGKGRLKKEEVSEREKRNNESDLRILKDFLYREKGGE